MPNFSIILIARNEEVTLPRLVKSLKHYQELGGEIIIVDTGSTDNTAQVARDLGCIVEEVGDRFITIIDEEKAQQINERFIVDDEQPLVTIGDKLFDFASARNFAASLGKNDMIAMPDCDEIYTKFDVEKIEEAIKNGVEQLEYNFVFSHDQFGNEAIKFLHCKFYDRRKLSWVGVVHEVLTGSANKLFLDESVVKLEHYQNELTNRTGYLRGLALDCYLHPENDRNSHYLAREMLWTGKPRSAIKEFKRHIAMNRWKEERGQSMIFIGDAYKALNNEDEMINWYNQAFIIDSSRREAVLRLAEYFYSKQDAQKVACYCAMALQVKEGSFYANNQSHYTHYPHELMYWAKWVLGDREESKNHFLKALKYQPLNSRYLHDARFYFNLPTISIIIPQLGREEGLKKCLDSIKSLNYPEELIDVSIIEGEDTVPNKVKQGVEKTKGEWIVYAANDMEFTPDSLILAILEDKDFVSFNSGIVSEDEGNICEHFLIKRSVIPGEIFDTEFNHVGVDNLLWAKMKKEGLAYRSTSARIIHNHFSTTGSYDVVYDRGWNSESVEKDRELLKIKLALLCQK